MLDTSTLSANAIILQDVIEIRLMTTSVYFLPILSNKIEHSIPPKGQNTELMEAEKYAKKVCNLKRHKEA